MLKTLIGYARRLAALAGIVALTTASMRAHHSRAEKR
jgi:hypothetical protein